jgi:hypothetical protein
MRSASDRTPGLVDEILTADSDQELEYLGRNHPYLKSHNLFWARAVPQHRLYLRPEPQRLGSLRPILLRRPAANSVLN